MDVAEDALMPTFREKLRELMDEKGLSIRGLATASGVPFGTIASYLSSTVNRRLPTLASAIALAKALGESVDIFSDCDDLQPDSTTGDGTNE